MAVRKTIRTKLRWAVLIGGVLALALPFAVRQVEAAGKFKGPVTAEHPWFDERDRLQGELAAEVADLQQQVARDFIAVIAAKDRCDEEGEALAEELIERMKQARDHLEPKLAAAEAWYAAIGTPGFFSEYNEFVTGIHTDMAERVVGGYRDAMSAIREQIADAEAYDPCSEVGDALPGDAVAETAAPAERGAKDKDQLEIVSSSQGAIPGALLDLILIPPTAAMEPAMADALPDDATQQPTDTVTGDGLYVVNAPCHEEVVLSGDELLAGDAVLEPKENQVVIWVRDIPTPPNRLAQEGSVEDEVLAVAAKSLEAAGRGDIGDYDVEIEQAGTTVIAEDDGSDLELGNFRVVLSPRQRPCLDSVQQAATIDGLPGNDDLGLPDGVYFDSEPPPAGDDDPGVDPFIPVAPASGTVEGTVERYDKRPAAVWPDDPHFQSEGSWGQAYPDQWGMRRVGFGAARRGAAASLWPVAGEPVIVAVIDTGVDRGHPELRRAIWVNEDEIAGNGIDDDNNGYIDDVHGWNFAGNDNDTRDIHGHGTVTAGIIAAATGNGIGIAGVNPWARIMPVRITTWSGRSTNFRLAEAIRYAVDSGARVINLSYGGRTRSWEEYLAIAHARRQGVIVVAAAGNDGDEAAMESPAGLPGVITVAASGVEDEHLGFSNWGPGVDIAAPGVDILSLRARHTDLLRFKRDDYQPGAVIVGADRRYYRLTGTSFSAPLVAGVASLVWSVDPELSDMQVMRKVLHSARDIDTPGWDQFTGYGLLDARAALAADPDFYLLARLTGVALAQTGAGPVVEVSGRARANRFRRSWVELGRGAEPDVWVRVSDDLDRPTEAGVLAAIPAGRFQGSKVWILRLIVEHANGTRREARFELTLG